MLEVSASLLKRLGALIIKGEAASAVALLTYFKGLPGQSSERGHAKLVGFTVPIYPCAEQDLTAQIVADARQKMLVQIEFAKRLVLKPNRPQTRKDCFNREVGVEDVGSEAFEEAVVHQIPGPPETDIGCAIQPNAGFCMTQFESQSPAWQ